MKKIFNWFSNKEINETLKQGKRVRKFRSFETMENVLILFDFKDKSEVDRIAQDIKSKLKNVILWAASSEPTNVNYSIKGLRVITNADLTKTKKISKALLTEFKALKYDTLISFANCVSGKDGVMHQLLRINNADFCIGIVSQDAEKLCDFIILKDQSESLWETYQHIKEYTGKGMHINFLSE